MCLVYRIYNFFSDTHQKNKTLYTVYKYNHVLAIRRAGPSQFSYSKPKTILHISHVLFTFYFLLIFMNVKGFKTERLHLYCRDFQLFYRIQDDKFPELTLAKPNSQWICFVFSDRQDINIYVLFERNYSKNVCVFCVQLNFLLVSANLVAVNC